MSGLLHFDSQSISYHHPSFISTYGKGMHLAIYAYSDCSYERRSEHALPLSEVDIHRSCGNSFRSGSHSHSLPELLLNANASAKLQVLLSNLMHRKSYLYR